MDRQAQGHRNVGPLAWSNDHLACWLVGWLTKCLVFSVVAYLVGWLVDYLVRWLTDCLAGFGFSFYFKVVKIRTTRPDFGAALDLGTAVTGGCMRFGV